MKIKKVSEYDIVNLMLSNACKNFKKIPSPLPWIEPSINMLYLESVNNYVLGQYYSCISTLGVLLEHTLKMAIIDTENAGEKRKIKRRDIDKYNGLSNIFKHDDLKEKILYLIENENNLKWWKETASIIRNKTIHCIIPELLKKFGSEKYQNLYPIELIGDYYNSGKWGYFWHRFGENLSLIFLNECTEQLKIVISNTLWKSDESWWISQKVEYENFFKYNWSIKNIINSLNNYLK